jgi:hypothetical protein
VEDDVAQKKKAAYERFAQLSVHHLTLHVFTSLVYSAMSADKKVERVKTKTI